MAHHHGLVHGPVGKNAGGEQGQLRQTMARAPGQAGQREDCSNAQGGEKPEGIAKAELGQGRLEAIIGKGKS